VARQVEDLPLARRESDILAGNLHLAAQWRALAHGVQYPPDDAPRDGDRAVEHVAECRRESLERDVFAQVARHPRTQR